MGVFDVDDDLLHPWRVLGRGPATTDLEQQALRAGNVARVRSDGSLIR